MNLQSEVTKWADATFANSTTSSKLLHLWDELEEAFAEARTSAQQEEIADCGLITMHLAGSLNVELPEPSNLYATVLRGKFQKCQGRTWGTADSRGVIRHQSREKEGE